MPAQLPYWIRTGWRTWFSPHGRSIPQAVFVRLRRAGWNVSPVLEGEYRFGTARLRVIGVEPLTMPAETQAVDLRNAGELLSFISPPGTLIVLSRNRGENTKAD